MNNIKLTKLGISFASLLFWLPAIISFFQSKGFEIGEVYFLVSFYSLCIVVLEYPTGVIGDYFSHKRSVQLGYLLLGSITILSIIQFPHFIYYLLLFILALGASLVSGSDIALLHSHSSDFKKDVADVKANSLIFLLVGTALGGLLAKINLNLPSILTGVSYAIAFIFISLTPSVVKVKEEGNIFSKAAEGITYLKKTSYLKVLFVIATLIGMFVMSEKWFFNAVFSFYNLDITYWGFIMSACIILTAIAHKLSKKVEKLNLYLLAITLTVFIFLSGSLNILIVFLISKLTFSFLYGFYEVKLETEFNKNIDNNIRASLLSLKSLFIRLTSAIYIFSAGYFLKFYPITTFLMLTGLTLGIVLTTVIVLGKSKWYTK